MADRTSFSIGGKSIRVSCFRKLTGRSPPWLLVSKLNGEWGICFKLFAYNYTVSRVPQRIQDDVLEELLIAIQISWFIYTYRYRLPEFGLLSTIPPHCVFARLKRNIPMSPTDLGAKISSLYHAPKLTLFGRSLLLLSCELMMNVVCWIVAGILFGRSENTRPVLSLALLAWVSTIYRKFLYHRLT